MLLSNNYPNLINKLEIHYYFHDDSHTMDAFVRNKCEAEALAILKEVLTTLNLNIEVDTEPYLEGGLKQIWKLLGKNQGQIAIVLSIISILMSLKPTGNETLERLQIKEAQLNIEKLKREARSDDSKENGSLETKPIYDTTEILSNNLRIIKHRSNFYLSLNTYSKITQISIATLNDKNEIVGTANVVPKLEFNTFILESDDLPMVMDEQANIAIVSPVLKKGKYKWKGIYEGHHIEFYMKDTMFKESITRQEISFKNGVEIECLLEKHKKVNELGDEFVANYNVITVLAIKEGSTTIETEQGKNYHKVKELMKTQLSLNLK